MSSPAGAVTFHSRTLNSLKDSNGGDFIVGLLCANICVCFILDVHFIDAEMSMSMSWRQKQAQRGKHIA